jgi:hypothetical protein
MTRNATFTGLAAVLLACCSGCGTFVNLLPKGRYMHIQWTD